MTETAPSRLVHEFETTKRIVRSALEAKRALEDLIDRTQEHAANQEYLLAKFLEQNGPIVVGRKQYKHFLGTSGLHRVQSSTISATQQEE